MVKTKAKVKLYFNAIDLKVSPIQLELDVDYGSSSYFIF